MPKYNLIVIGGGTAGLVASTLAASLQAKVLLIESGKLGGDCLNTGCVPSKALIRTSRYIRSLRLHSDLGVTDVNFEVNFEHVMDRVRTVIKEIEPHDSIDTLEAKGIEVKYGFAKVVNRNQVAVGNDIYTANSIILGMGCGPMIPDIPGIQEVEPISSDTIWNLTCLPEKFLVIGGGPLGCELAQAFCRLGSHVTLVERSSRLLHREDPRVSASISRSFEQEGIRVICDATPISFVTGAARYSLNLQVGYGGAIQVDFDKVLVAVGRVPRTDGMEWTDLGIKLDSKGFLVADKHLRVNGSNIYGCGDIIGGPMYTHAAGYQATVATINALFWPIKREVVNYDALPRVTFTDPEVARVGHTQASATREQIRFRETAFDLANLDRAIADSTKEGYCSILTKQKSGKILGAVVVGEQAGEVMQVLATGIQNNIPLDRFLRQMYPYPTMTECVREVAHTRWWEDQSDVVKRLYSWWHRKRL